MNTDAHHPDSPLIVKRHNGIAGQFSLTAEKDGEPVTFVGSVYGSPGPVVLVMTPNGSQSFVSEPGRFGSKFNEEWVRAFFAACDDEDGED